MYTARIGDKYLKRDAGGITYGFYYGVQGTKFKDLHELIKVLEEFPNIDIEIMSEQHYMTFRIVGTK